MEQTETELVLITKNHRGAKEVHQPFDVLRITNTEESILLDCDRESHSSSADRRMQGWLIRYYPHPYPNTIHLHGFPIAYSFPPNPHHPIVTLCGYSLICS